MKLFLVRHGETDWNKQKRFQGREDIELNSCGIIQAEQCGQVFQKISIDCIISSPLKRAKETADIIASQVGIETVIIEENLIERDYGRLSGLFYDEREKFFSSGQNVEMESSDNLSQRVIRALNYYCSETDYENIIMVSHGGVINAILAELSEHSIGTGETTLKNACISILKYTNKYLEIELYNLTADEFSETMRYDI